MTISIDATTYLKTRWHIGRGYDKRLGVARPSAIIVHSTNGRKGSTFHAEAVFLRDSADVSAHYLVGKSGQVVCIVPDVLRAWHSGAVVPSVFSNNTSIGIECHFTPGETFSQAGIDALSELVKLKMRQYGIPFANVDMHRKVARPIGRKIDPSFWGDSQFYEWRARFVGLVLSPTPAPQSAIQRYTVRPGGGTLRSKPERSAGNVARNVQAGTVLFITGNVAGDSVLGNSTWLVTSDNPPLYIHSSAVERV